MNTVKSFAASVIVAACVALPAAAAEIEEIVVTATKRGERVAQGLAESVHVLAAEGMTERRQFDFESFAASVPDSYTVVDVYAGVDVSDNFTMGLYAKNLFDELAVYDGIGTFQDPESIVAARPRTFGISGRYRF